MLKVISSGLLALLVSSAASANMFVDRSIVEFVAGQAPQQDIRVSNRGNDQMYVQVEVLDVLQPGTNEETREAVTNLADMTLLATPKQFVLPPQGERAVRLVALAEPGEVDQVYRVNVTPILPPLADTEASVVRVVVAYQLLVLVLPENPREDLVVTRDGNVLKFENRGNSYVLLADGQQCITENCSNLPTTRLYAGNSWEVELESSDVVASYRLTTFAGSRTVTW
ncbi:fimbrial biogenesis chaperone [Umboniibacter marinipuniceus]|uniref:P pilus assembly chaperone PapD n=1 Tax=Umboniibacter marinipuniceus TaxID=569599 RepID=A0A3M0A8D4_9GAMM|nr:fimbria/pilus periplasmic chaperone [Umboniibacter marinipuniceus]RMA81363.1 P pilus assembly chaperone PapD [Umboniibacter marinipuniceus]